MRTEIDDERDSTLWLLRRTRRMTRQALEPLDPGAVVHDDEQAWQVRDVLGHLGVWNGDAFALGNLWNIAGQCWVLAGILATGVLPSFTKKTKIQAVVNVTAAATGTGSFTAVIYYVVDPTIAL